MTDLLTLAGYLPLVPLLPLLILAVALIGELAGELRRILIDIGAADPLVMLAPVYQPTGDNRGPLVRFIAEERAERAVLTARQRGDIALTIRASLALQAGDYGRALALAGAACRVGR